MKQSNLFTFIVLVALMIASCGHPTKKTKKGAHSKKDTTAVKAADEPGSTQKPRTVITLLIDDTDTTGDRTSVVPKKALIDSLLGSNQTSAGTVYFKTITNVSMTKAEGITFAGMAHDENSLKLRRMRRAFEKKLSVPYKKYLAPASGRSNSVIYRNVCKAMNDLDRQEGTKKILIIVSDLVEFSSDGDFYKVNTSEEGIEAAIAKLKQSGEMLPENSNIRVIVLFDPEGDDNKDAAFNRAWKVWETLFDESGIQYDKPRANL